MSDVMTLESAVRAVLTAATSRTTYVSNLPEDWIVNAQAALESNNLDAIRRCADEIWRPNIRTSANENHNRWLFDLRAARRRDKHEQDSANAKPPEASSEWWHGAIFIGVIVVVAIGMNWEERSREGKARIEYTYERAAQNIANDVECDDIKYPRQCAEIRRQAADEARKKLAPYH